MYNKKADSDCDRQVVNTTTTRTLLGLWIGLSTFTYVLTIL